VTIIHDSLAYAVGEIYLSDSTGQVDENPYNLLRWNGHRWQFLRVLFYGYCGLPYTWPAPADAVLAFGESDILIASSSQVARWTIDHQAGLGCVPLSINRLWGKSLTSLYAVGGGGRIALYDGTSWQLLESGITTPVYDIWGSSKKTDGDLEILAIASSDLSANGGTQLLSVRGATVTLIPISGIPASMRSVWFSGTRRYFLAGDGLFSSLSSPTDWLRVGSYPNYYITTIRGTGVDDVFLVGAFGLIVHFNGSTWADYLNDVSLPSGGLADVAIKDDLVIAVGGNGEKGIAVIGHRP
jgi:hypothetical protein